MRSGCIILLACSYLVSVPSAWAQQLNSERIEQTFGSYGIDVIYAEDDMRISNLYSLHGGAKVMRTLAIVELPSSIDDAIAAEHQAILDGGSIGAVFTDAGWEVVKTGHSYFSTGLPPAVLEAMGITENTRFAAHYYQLALAKRRRTIDYALIIEIHHPDYLGEAALEAIYGPEEIVGMLQPVRRLLVRATEQFTRFGLTPATAR
jgi:hypothetical protein